jgi:hypothetical protein
MARLLPPGALLALEAPDLASLLRDWNGSPERATWLASENYQAFERSRLFLRLREAQEEFAAAAGAPANMALLSDVAGGASALGVYDIGNLELLFVTRLVSGRAIENALWRLRGSYEPREAAALTDRRNPALVNPIALVGETEHDAREVMVEGISGLMAVHGRGDRPIWIPSRRRLEFKNGAVAQVFSAEDPESLRGPQFAAAWCDELAKWRHADATFTCCSSRCALASGRGRSSRPRRGRSRCSSACWPIRRLR